MPSTAKSEAEAGPPPAPEARKPAWIRDQILANAKFLYPSKYVGIITGRDSMNSVRYDGAINARHMHYAHLFSTEDPQLVNGAIGNIGKPDEPQNGNGNSVENGRCARDGSFVVLVYGTPVVGNTEDALDDLLGKVEDQLHKMFGRWKSALLYGK